MPIQSRAYRNSLGDPHDSGSRSKSSMRSPCRSCGFSRRMCTFGAWLASLQLDSPLPLVFEMGQRWHALTLDGAQEPASETNPTGTRTKRRANEENQQARRALSSPLGSEAGHMACESFPGARRQCGQPSGVYRAGNS
jgi:hypothetical protein